MRRSDRPPLPRPGSRSFRSSSLWWRWIGVGSAEPSTWIDRSSRAQFRPHHPTPASSARRLAPGASHCARGGHPPVPESPPGQMTGRSMRVMNDTGAFSPARWCCSHSAVARPAGAYPQPVSYVPEIYVANSDDQFVTVIDAVQNSIIKKIDVPGGAIEQPRYNPSDGRMYMTGSEDNVVYQFDPTSDTIVSKTDVVDKCNPNGLAINPNTNQALLGCSNRDQPQHAALWDLKAAKV